MSVTGGLEEGGGEGGTVGDFVEFSVVEVIEEDQEAEDFFDDGERVGGGDGRECGVVED